VLDCVLIRRAVRGSEGLSERIGCQKDCDVPCLLYSDRPNADCGGRDSDERWLIREALVNGVSGADTFSERSTLNWFLEPRLSHSSA
jgi:hypothetical protein